MAYKEELDRHLDPEASTIVMSKSRGDSPGWAKWTPGAEELEQVVARFNDPADPLKIIIVTAKLLTGFDAPILHCQYLDKPLKEHTLLQAITRTNRVYPPNKTHGLIVDYLGIFDDVAKSLAFDEQSRAAGDLQHRGAEEAARPGDGRGAGVLPRRGPHRRRVRGAGAGAGRDRRRRHQGRVRPGLQRRVAAVGGDQPRPDARRVPGRLPVADRRVRVGAPLRHHRPAGLARPRRQDHRPDQRARPGRDPARAPRPSSWTRRPSRT